MNTKDNPISVKKLEIPEFELPKGFTVSIDYLRHLVLQGLERRYSGKLNTVVKQAEYELEVIEKLGYVDYFLIIADIIIWAREHDIPFGPGRAQAPSSLIVYALGITDIDPIKYGFIFERFINPEYPLVPDIDIDFSIKSDKKIKNYIVKKYGKNRLGLISTYSVNKNGKKISGIHAAGIIISRNNLDSYGAVYHDPKTDLLVTKYDISELDTYGLVKFDFLGLKALDIIQQGEMKIRKQGGQFADFSIHDIPLDDNATFNLFRKGKTNGVFYFESEGIKEVLRQVEPDCFEHLISLNALYRPGPLTFIPEYIERRLGYKPIEYPLPCLEDILKETYGFIIYQEQLMRIIQRIAGYTPGKSDILRRYLDKAVAAKQDTAEEKKRFITGAKAQGFNKHEAESIFDQLISVVGTVYPKSHCASYSLLSYQIAYLKANF